MTLLDTLSINGRKLSEATFTADDFREWQPLEIECRPLPEVVDAALTIGDVDLGPPTSVLGDNSWRWRWNPQHAVGHYLAALRLRYADGQTRTERFPLRILPRRIDAERYEAMLSEIQQDARALVYALSGGRMGSRLEPVAPTLTLVEEYYLLVERHVAQALTLVQQLTRSPHSKLVSGQADTQLWELQRIEPAMLADMVRAPLDDVSEDVLPPLQAALRGPDRERGGPLPQSFSTRRSQPTTDLIEHRVLKQVLRVLLSRVVYVRSIAKREQTRRQQNAGLAESRSTAAVERWVAGCDKAAVKLRRALSLPWLQPVDQLGTFTQPTPLMRREPRYRRLYQLYRDLRSTPWLAFDSQLLWLPIHELPLLYEQWCTLRVVKALLPLGLVVEQSMVERADEADSTEERRWTMRLRQERPLLVLALADGAKVTVWYQRRYQPAGQSAAELGTLDPFVRIPDIALEVQRPDCPPKVLVADAKYRVAPDGGIPQDALDDAYAYRSAIGAGGSRATLGALLLFPGTQPLLTRDRVGAIPLLPKVDSALTGLLQSFLLSEVES